MPPPSHPVDKRHDGPDSRHNASLRAESDIFFWQISLIAWPLKAMAEDAMGLRREFAAMHRRLRRNESMSQSTTPTGDQT
jgi:hypothetical protein